MLILERWYLEEYHQKKIIEVAEKEDVDLIIISASGKSGLHRFLIGGVAERVLKNSKKDVLLVHND